MSKMIVIRADASDRIGGGHVMRCLALAQRLKAHGAEIVFLMRDLPGNLIDYIRKSGFSVFVTDSHQSEAEGITQCLSLHKIKPDGLILDHYQILPRMEEELKLLSGCFLISFDDTGMAHKTDALINTNLGASPKTYRHFTIPHIFAGPQYACLRQEFLSLNPEAFIPGSKILISLGQADPQGYTLRVIKTLLRHSKPLELLITIAPGSQGFSELKALASQNSKLELIIGSRQMLPWMQKSGFAFLAAGSTILEALRYGLPFCSILCADNQKNNFDCLIRESICPTLTPDKIETSLLATLDWKPDHAFEKYAHLVGQKDLALDLLRAIPEG